MHHGQLLGEEKLNWEAEKGTGVKTGFRGVQLHLDHFPAVCPWRNGDDVDQEALSHFLSTC